MNSETKKAMKKHATRCFYCKCSLVGKPRTVDHMTPESRGGLDTRENTVVACVTCNEDKGHLTVAEYKAVLIYRLLVMLKNAVCGLLYLFSLE